MSSDPTPATSPSDSDSWIERRGQDVATALGAAGRLIGGAARAAGAIIGQALPTIGSDVQKALEAERAKIAAQSLVYFDKYKDEFGQKVQATVQAYLMANFPQFPVTDAAVALFAEQELMTIASFLAARLRAQTLPPVPEQPALPAPPPSEPQSA